MNNIINVFKNEKELFDYYPKTFYWSLKGIFNDYWDSFLDFAKEKILFLSVLNVVMKNFFIILVNLDFVIPVALNMQNFVLLLLNLFLLMLNIDILFLLCPIFFGLYS